jgi:NADH-quinone oxidoreductase subunit L
VTDTILQDTALITPGILIPLLPLAGFLINGLLAKFIPKSISGWLASACILVSFCCSMYIFTTLDANEKIYINLFEWIKIGSIQIDFGFLIDSLTVVMLLIITGIGFLIHLYSIGYMHDDEGFTRFFTYLNLFVFFMLLLVMGSNFLITFIGWEGVGLCSYLLIGFWFKNDAYNDAAKKAFVMNRIGDLGFLLGMFLLLFHFGTLDYQTINSKADLLASSSPALITLATMLLFVGATGKSAQIPLYTWLPDAMAGPTPVSALIHAATMVTAGIYMIVRANVLFSYAHYTSHVILVIGVCTALFSSIIGLKQNDIKKVLAYSTVSQLGYMFAALGVGAYKTALFHVVTHAFFKALLFLGSGSVIHAMHGEQDIRKMGGLRKALPITHLTFLIGTLAIAGVPGLSGFFSKDEILAAVHMHGEVYFIVLAGTAIITAIYMFRLYWLTFAGDFRGTDNQKHHLHESPATITLPLVILALLSVLGGYLGMPEIFHAKHLFASYLNSSVASVPHMHASHFFEWVVIGVSFIVLAAIIIGTFNYYIKRKTLPEEEANQSTLSKLVYHKFYVDELYTTFIVNPLKTTSDLFLVLVDKLIIDLVVSAIAWIVSISGKTIRLIQTGNTGFYLLAMVMGSVLFLFIRLLF